SPPRPCPASVFLNSSQAVVITDAHRRIIKVNEGFSTYPAWGSIDIARDDDGRLISQPMEIRGTTIRTSASIGIGFYPDDGDTPESLYRAADDWIYRSKRTNRDDPQYCFFDISESKG
ncbi:MAG: diguanylate cyclase, partial [Candidatus Thiodiazotropha sp.]